MHLDAPFIGLCLGLCMSSFRTLGAGSGVFAMHLTLWYIVFVCHQKYVHENYIGSVFVGGYCGISYFISYYIFCTLMSRNMFEI